MRFKLLYIVIFILIPKLNWGSNLLQIEQELGLKFKQLKICKKENKIDSIIKINKDISKTLLTLFKENLESLTYDFPQLKDYEFYIATSPDKEFRIYSWNTLSNDTINKFENIYQWYQYDTLRAKLKFHQVNENTGYYSYIYKLTDELNSFYIGYFHSTSKDKKSLQAFHTIDYERESFQSKFKKIKTKSGNTHSISIIFDYPNLSEIEEQSLKLIKYNTEEQSFKFPIILKNGIVSNKYIVYLYDGDYFIRQ